MENSQTFPLISIAPFVLTLLAIAILPLVSPQWWEPLKKKALVMGIFALPVAGFLLRHDPHELLKSLGDYASFLSLLGALFVISGGILLTGDLKATPKVNAAFLLIGALLANLIGTTGASMLLIRPLLRTNQERKHVTHIFVFFIFLVSNIGGVLTPLGDPPLFLGFLHGVPFDWTLHLWPQWAIMIALLVGCFFLIDAYQYSKEASQDLVVDSVQIEPLKMRGLLNLPLLAGVLALVLFVPPIWREVGMVFLALASYRWTSRDIHEQNHFSFFPIQEVAILFLGIFVTMAPALVILEHRGSELGLVRPDQFFWATGILSSFLDNAPTYLTMASVALSSLGLGSDGSGDLMRLVNHPQGAAILSAISLGAVFMGANTYIGNGPNFMVKAICESRGIRMPSFFGYMIWSGLILVPPFAGVALIFLA